MTNGYRPRVACGAILLFAAQGGCGAGPETAGEPDQDESTEAAAEQGAQPSWTPEEAAVVEVIDRLFDAMREGDGAKAATVFHADARLGRADDDGVDFRPAAGFVQSIGRPRDQVWDERIWDTRVRVDGRLAQLWTKFAFYLDSEFMTCGTNAFELYRTDEQGWQVTQLVDTSRSEDCWHPPEAQRP